MPPKKRRPILRIFKPLSSDVLFPPCNSFQKEEVVGSTGHPVIPWHHYMKRVNNPSSITHILTHKLGKDYVKTMELPEFTNDLTIQEVNNYIHTQNKPEGFLYQEAKSPTEFIGGFKGGTLNLFKPLYKGLISLSLYQGYLSQDNQSEPLCVLSMSIICKDGFYETQLTIKKRVYEN